jgi:hypothetical protein
VIYGNDPSIEFGDTPARIGATLRIITGLLLSGAMIAAMAQRPDSKDWPVYSGADNGQRNKSRRRTPTGFRRNGFTTWMVQAAWSKRPS